MSDIQSKEIDLHKWDHVATGCLRILILFGGIACLVFGFKSAGNYLLWMGALAVLGIIIFCIISNRIENQRKAAKSKQDELFVRMNEGEESSGGDQHDTSLSRAFHVEASARTTRQSCDEETPGRVDNPKLPWKFVFLFLLLILALRGAAAYFYSVDVPSRPLVLTDVRDLDLFTKIAKRKPNERFDIVCVLNRGGGIGGGYVHKEVTLPRDLKLYIRIPKREFGILSSRLGPGWDRDSRKLLMTGRAKKFGQGLYEFIISDSYSVNEYRPGEM